VYAHLRGLRRMIGIRGGIDKFSIDGVFLHMLCKLHFLETQPFVLAAI
jgi:hypothetical protein